MIVTITNNITPKQARDVIRKAQQINYERKNKRKLKSLKKFGGMLSHLKKSPLEIQK